jgi:hypothetical protein
MFASVPPPHNSGSKAASESKADAKRSSLDYIQQHRHIYPMTNQLFKKKSD